MTTTKTELKTLDLNKIPALPHTQNPKYTPQDPQEALARLPKSLQKVYPTLSPTAQSYLALFTDRKVKTQYHWIDKLPTGDSSTTAPSLCWFCKRACNPASHPCSWAERATPVPGWETVPTTYYDSETRTYEESHIVCACPYYELEEDTVYPQKEYKKYLATLFGVPSIRIREFCTLYNEAFIVYKGLLKTYADDIKAARRASTQGSKDVLTKLHKTLTNMAMEMAYEIVADDEPTYKGIPKDEVIHYKRKQLSMETRARHLKKASTRHNK